MKRPSRPPRLARFILGRMALHRAEPTLQGELDELFTQRVQRDGRWFAAFWYWRQVVSFAIHAPSLRRDSRRTSHTMSFGAMTGIVSDIRSATRGLVRAPGFSAVAILTLALGIGANTAIFSVVNAVLIRPLPYIEPEQLVTIRSVNSEWEHSDVPRFQYMWNRGYSPSMMDYRDWIEMNSSFQALGAFIDGEFTLTGADRPERIGGARVTSGLFTTLGVGPVLGRTLVAAEDAVGASPAVVLSHRLWMRSFAGDSRIAAKTITLNDHQYTVVGVMPSGFYFPHPAIELWTTMDEEDKQRSRGWGELGVVGRLHGQVTLERARTDMSRVAKGIAEANPGANNGDDVKLIARYAEVVGGARPALLMLVGAVGAVLLIGCANVAGLLLARATERRKEIAVRSALGAGRGRLLRQMMSESAIIASLGAAIGIAVAASSMGPLKLLLPASLPRASEISLDLKVLLFAVALGIGTAVLTGLLPAARAVRLGISALLQESGRGTAGTHGGNRAQSTLVVGEIAIAFVLLVGASLLLKSFVRLTAVELGFQAENVATMEVTLSELRYSNAQRTVSFFETMMQRVAAIPGVTSVGAIRELPFADPAAFGPLAVERDSRVEMIDIERAVVTPEYFDVLQIPLRAGRHFTAADRDGSVPVTIVTEAMAEEYWPRSDPIGKRVGFPRSREWMVVVGVVGNVRHEGLTAAWRPKLYQPFAQAPSQHMSVVLKATNNPDLALAAAQRAIWEIDGDLPVNRVVTMNELIGQSVSEPRFQMLLLGFLASLAAVLALVGVYGIVAYAVAQRTQEIGIRMALGAAHRRVVRDVLRHGLVLAGTGLAIGVTVAWFSVRVLDRFLFEANTADPLLMAVCALGLAAATLLATLVPAIRAARLDPMLALGRE